MSTSVASNQVTTPVLVDVDGSSGLSMGQAVIDISSYRVCEAS